MSEWKEYKLGEIAEIVGGGTPSTKNTNFYGGQIPWITPRDLTSFKDRYISKGERNITEEGLNNSSAKLMPKNSILLTSRAPIGYLAIANNPVSTNQGFKSLIVDPKKANHIFVYYLLKANIERIKSLGTGTTFAEISGSVVKTINVNLPPLPTQTAIAEILSSLDDKIELNNAINKNLEDLAQALFKRWFVDFEFPNEDGLPYQSSGGEMVESELGMIPKGWRVVKLEELLNVKYGKDHKHLEEGNIPVYGSGGIMRFVDQALYEKVSILIPRKGTLSNLFFLEEPFWSVDTMFYSEIHNELFAKYIYYQIKALNLSSMNVGSAVPSMTTKVLNNLLVLCPDEGIVKQFDDALSPIFNSKRNALSENKNLVNIRDALLPKLISGELEVNQALSETKKPL